jgi:hypothetical protein
MMKSRFVIALVVALIGLSANARADFVGQLVTVVYDSNSVAQGDQKLNLGTQTIAGSGNSFTSYQGIFTPTVSGDEVELDYTEVNPVYWNDYQVSFNGPVIEEAASGPAITGATLTSSGLTGLISSPLTFDSHDIFLNWAGATADVGAEVVISVQFAGDPVATPLPRTAFAGFGLLAGAAAFAGFSRPASGAANRR